MGNRVGQELAVCWSCAMRKMGMPGTGPNGGEFFWSEHLDDQPIPHGANSTCAICDSKGPLYSIVEVY